MANRYGRNQKRAHRAMIADLEGRLAAANAYGATMANRAHTAEYRASNARQAALTEFANQEPRISMAMQEIGAGLGHALGKELEPHARKLLDADRTRRPFSPVFRGDAHMDMTTMRVDVLRGEIPSFHYNIALTGW